MMTAMATASLLATPILTTVNAQNAGSHNNQTIVAVDTNHAPETWVANDADTINTNMATQGISSLKQLGSYKVVWGDTLSMIAEHFGVSVDEITKTFGIQNPDLIITGVTIQDQAKTLAEMTGTSVATGSVAIQSTTGSTTDNAATAKQAASATKSANQATNRQGVKIAQGSVANAHKANDNVTDAKSSTPAQNATATSDVQAAKDGQSTATPSTPVVDNGGASSVDKAAADQAAADKAATDKAAADQAAADQAAADKAAADQAAADKAAADQAAADKAAADKAAADKAAADKAAADKAAADQAAADKAAADQAAADKTAADKAATDQAAADKAAADQAAADKAAADQAAADKAAAEQAAADKAAADQAAADKAAADQAAADKAAADQAAADKAAADQAAADKAAADKAAADQAAADKAAADQAAADKAAADKAAAPINMNLLASGTDTIGKYAKKLYVSFSGFESRPMTITGIKVLDGSGVTTVYTKEQLEDMGVNVNLASGQGLGGVHVDLPSQNSSKVWDTSNLTISLDVQLENGQTSTVTTKIVPSPSGEEDSIPVITQNSVVYSNGDSFRAVGGLINDKSFTTMYSNSTTAWFTTDPSHKLKAFANKNGIITEFNADGSISNVYYDQAYDKSNLS